MTLGKKTKIVCTIGPATKSKEKLEQLMNAGMNVIRLNFSHGDFADHQEKLDNMREIMKETGKTVGILQDLSGPKIRIGKFKEGKIVLKKDQVFTLTTDECMGDETRVFVKYPNLAKEVKVGGFIMLQDGTKKLEITDIQGNDIITKVIAGGTIGDHKGVNLPGANLSISSLTDKDKVDVEFGIKNKVDFIALSFVRRASDIAELRAILDKAGCKAHVIAKIETPEALHNIDEILALSDGVMVARGDLAIEIPAEEVPLAQKMLIRKCNSVGKPVITATQMLESMIESPVPTRAEVSDIANAIIDGTDAIMLSEETTLGKFPVEAVEIMSRVALRVESEVYTRDTIAEYKESHGVTDVASRGAVRAAHSLGAKLIVALTRSGRTARMVARYRPAESILALSDSAQDANKLTLSFGCYPMVTSTFKNIDEILDIVRKKALDNKIVRKGSKVVIVAGMPFGIAKETNLMMVETL